MLNYDFFNRDVLEVAPDLVGKIIVRTLPNGTILKQRITETEAYRGIEDKACHAHKGRTKRTEVMYQKAGTIYVYMIYGMHYLFNIVCSDIDNPQAVLIRCVEDYSGPGKLTKHLNIDKTFNSKDISKLEELYIEDDNFKPEIIRKKRIGIDYAGEIWGNKLWRFVAKL
jgi:DNA-3-methyladenine glycosylase